MSILAASIGREKAMVNARGLALILLLSAAVAAGVAAQSNDVLDTILGEGATTLGSVAYVVLTLYTLLAGFFFLLGVVSFVETLRQAQAFQAFDFLQQMNLKLTV